MPPTVTAAAITTFARQARHGHRLHDREIWRQMRAQGKVVQEPEEDEEDVQAFLEEQTRIGEATGR